MGMNLEEKGLADGREDYTEDGTVDLKGRPVLRSKTGRWRACSFIVGKAPCTILFGLINYVFQALFLSYIHSSVIHNYRLMN